MGESYKGPCSEHCVENYPSLVFVNYVSDHHSSSGKDVIKYKPFMDAEDVLKFLLSEFARRGQYDEIFEDDADAVSKEETVYTLHHTVHLRASASGGAFLGTRRQASLSLSLSPPPFSPTLSLANYLPAPPELGSIVRKQFYIALHASGCLNKGAARGACTGRQGQGQGQGPCRPGRQGPLWQDRRRQEGQEEQGSPFRGSLHEFSDPGLTTDEAPLDTYRHFMVMDRNAGGCLGFGKAFPEANLVPCSRHMASNVKNFCGAEAKRQYFEGLKAPTKHALEQVWVRWRASPDAGVKKMVSYFDSRAPPANNKIHLFPAKSEIRGMSTPTRGTRHR